MLEKENNYTLKTYMSPKKDYIYFNRNFIHFQPLIFRGNIRYFSEKHLPNKNLLAMNSENEAFPDFFGGGRLTLPETNSI